MKLFACFREFRELGRLALPSTTIEPGLPLMECFADYLGLTSPITPNRFGRSLDQRLHILL